MEPTAVGPFAERRVLFETGLEVDFALLPVAAARQIAHLQVRRRLREILNPPL